MNQLEPVVTIGIPTYQRPELLDKALARLLLQKYKNIKIIVSDNGTDSELIIPIINKYKRIFLFIWIK